MPLLDELAAHLVTQGVGALASTIFYGPKAVIPDGIGPYLSLIETEGIIQIKTQHTSRYPRPSVQIVARASTRAVARAKVKQAFDAFSSPSGGLYNITLSGTFYLSIDPSGEIFDLPLDEKSRPRCAFNLDIVKTPS